MDASLTATLKERRQWKSKRSKPMALELKRDRTTVVERVAANALNRRALLVTSLAVAGAFSAGAGLDGAQEPAKAAQSVGQAAAERKCCACPWRLGRRLELGQGDRRLSAKGIKAWAAPLPLTSLADDVASLDRTLDRVEGPIILAAHAYAGAVIAGSRSREGQRRSSTSRRSRRTKARRLRTSFTTPSRIPRRRNSRLTRMA